MDTKTKELIGIGAAVTANCVPCLQALVKKGREVGVTDDEIQIAIGVGRRVRKGAQGYWDSEATVLVGETADAPCPLSE